MTLATIDRLVHHATILEVNVESYRRKVQTGRPFTPLQTSSTKSMIDAGNAA